jgi:large subunit ribosomal protein L30
MGKISITLRRSPINRYWKQRRTLRTLGLTKLHQTVEKEDTPQIRGMIRKVEHMVETNDKK